MATIVTRSGKGSALTHTEMDANTTNLNNEIGTNLTELNTKPDIDEVQAWTRQQTFTEYTLTDDVNIAWDLDLGQAAKVTLTDNRTLSAPTNAKAGGLYVIRIIQDGTGSHTLAYNSVYKFAGGSAPTLTTTAAAVDILDCVSDGTNMFCRPLLDVK